MKSRPNTHMKQFMVAGVIAIAAMAIETIHEVAPHFTRDKFLVKVTGMETVTSTPIDFDGMVPDDSKYVVFTKDAKTGEVRPFENTDTLVEYAFGGCKSNSSDIQKQLAEAKKSGKLVELSTYGWRIPFFSSYKNIVDVKEADK